MPFQIPVFYTEFYTSIGIYDYGAQMGLQCLIGVSLLALIFRIALFIAYQNIYATYLLQSKEINEKKELENIKFGFFSKVVKFYVSVVEKGVVHLSPRDVVERQLGRSRFLLLNLKSYKGVLDTFEKSILLIGIILTLTVNEKATVAAICVFLFVVIKVVGLFLDYTAVESKIVFEMSNFMEIEINKFFGKDPVSAINLLRVDIKNSIQAQTSGLRETISMLGTELGEAMGKSMAAMTENVENAMTSVLNHKEILDEPIKKWRDTINEAVKGQDNFNKTLASLNVSIQGVEKLSNIVDGGFAKMSGSMGDYFSSLSKQVASLEKTADALYTSNSNYMARNDEVEQQLKYLKTNQIALENSLQQYELTLKEITSQIGEGMGRIIDFQVQEAYNGINESLRQNLDSIIKSNSELIERLQSVFAQMQEQSRSEMNAIMSIKEQMDMNFKMLGR